MPGASVLQFHQVFLPAVYQDAAAVIRGFGDVAQYIDSLFLMGHVRLFDQTGQRLPRDDLLAAGYDTVRKSDVPPHIIFKACKTFLGQPAVDQDRTFRRGGTAKLHFYQFERPVVLNILQKRDDLCQPPGIVHIGRVQRTVAYPETYADLLAEFLSEQLCTAEQNEYGYDKISCAHFDFILSPS